MFRPRLDHPQVHILAQTETCSIKQNIIQLCADCYKVYALSYCITKRVATLQNLEENFKRNNSTEKILFVRVICSKKKNRNVLDAFDTCYNTKGHVLSTRIRCKKTNKQTKNVSDTPLCVTKYRYFKKSYTKQKHLEKNTRVYVKVKKSK